MGRECSTIPLVGASTVAHNSGVVGRGELKLGTVAQFPGGGLPEAWVDFPFYIVRIYTLKL